MPTESPRRARQREIEIWIARVRLGAVLFGIVEVGLLSTGYPPGYEGYAWITTGVFAVGALLLFVASKRADPRVVGLVALVFDTCVIAAYATIYSFEYGSPTRWALMFVVTEAALRYGLVGAVVLPVVLLPYLVFAEWWRVHHFHDGPGFIWDRVTFPFGVFLITGAIVGWLVKRLGREAAVAEARAREAETLRDELGRRVDVLEAANRCARALASSLDLDQAFGAFSRELRGLVAFERVTLVLVAAGRGLRPGGGARGKAGVPRLHGPTRVPRGGGAAQPRLAQPGARPVAGRTAHDRDAGARACGRGRVRAGGARARLAAGTAGRDGRAEHPRVRGRAEHGGRAAAAVGAARRLRLARLARAAKPDGRGDRRRAHAARAVARADAGAASVVSRADRRRDLAARDADRRRPRHVADRSRNVQLHVQRRRPRGAVA